MTAPKQTLYKTAYSPMYDCFVSINHAHQDDLGQWIYTCSSDYKDPKKPYRLTLTNVLFRECELARITL